MVLSAEYPVTQGEHGKDPRSATKTFKKETTTREVKGLHWRILGLQPYDCGERCKEAAPSMPFSSVQKRPKRPVEQDNYMGPEIKTLSCTQLCNVIH